MKRITTTAMIKPMMIIIAIGTQAVIAKGGTFTAAAGPFDAIGVLTGDGGLTSP